MNKAHLYRLQQIHEIEKEIHFEKIKQESVIKKYHCVINVFSCLFHTCPVLYVFVECRLFSQFSRNHRQHFRKDFARIELDFWKCLNFSESS